MSPTAAPAWSDAPRLPARQDSARQPPLRGLHPDLIVCPQCDVVQARPTLAPFEHARCVRCLAPLARGHWLDLNGQLAITVTGLICFALANLFPIIELEVQGRMHGSTLPEAAWMLLDAGAGPVAALAFGTGFVCPLIELMLRLCALLSVLRPGGTGQAAWHLRALERVEKWSMAEVYLIGMLVTVFKIGSTARVIPDIGLFSFAALTVLIGVLRHAGHQSIIDAGPLPPGPPADGPDATGSPDNLHGPNAPMAVRDGLAA